MIGLYDADFASYIPVMFNLEIMRLSSYYKRRREVVLLMPELDVDRFSQVIVRKDYDDGNYDRKIFLPKVTYGGRAFSPKKYAPLSLIQEQTVPDATIYLRFQKKYSYNTSHNELFNTMMQAAHTRLSIDGATINPDYDKYIMKTKGKTLILHDYDVAKIEGAAAAINDSLKRLNTKMPKFIDAKLGVKFPINIYNDNEFKEWIEIPASANFFTLQYNGQLSNDQLKNYVDQVTMRSYKLNYNVTHGLSTENDFIENHLLKIFRQVSFLRTIHKQISLTFDDGFFIDKRWERLIKLFNGYLKYCITKKNTDDITLFKYVTLDNFYSGYNWFTIEEVRDLFQMVREKNYETFKMFYEVSLLNLEGDN